MPDAFVFVAAHRFDVCCSGKEANCGIDGRANAVVGAVILLKGARNERGCAIGAAMVVVLATNNFQMHVGGSGMPRLLSAGHVTFRSPFTPWELAPVFLLSNRNILSMSACLYEIRCDKNTSFLAL